MRLWKAIRAAFSDGHSVRRARTVPNPTVAPPLQPPDIVAASYLSMWRDRLSIKLRMSNEWMGNESVRY